MKRFFPYILILVLIVGVFSPFTADAFIVGEGCVPSWYQPFPNLADCFTSIVGGLLYGILTIIALILMICGLLLDLVIEYSIVDMKENLQSLTGINTAWKILKDLMNIAFIFILLFEAIKLIIGQGSRESVKRFIIGIVLASILINFSLFFTKVLIDASNVITVGLYDAIINTGNVTAGETVIPGGLTVPFMRAVGITSFYSNDTFESMMRSSGGNVNLLFIPLLGMVLFLILCFVFLAMAVMLTVRFLTILILLVLSPIAYMGLALDFMKPYASQWWNTFNSQLIFPPVFMLMMLVSMTIFSSPGFITVGGSWGVELNQLNPQNNSGFVNLLFKFAIIIGLSIASLVISKSISNKGSSHIATATSKLSGYAGGVVMGGGAMLGRSSLGRLGGKIADDAKLQEEANKQKGLRGGIARAALYTARTARDATYDARNAVVPTSVIGDTVRGTLGRTRVGQVIGADDFRTSSVEVGKPMSNLANTGVGGKSYGETEAEKAKRLRDERNKDNEELKLARAKQDIINGANADGTDPKDPAYLDAIDKMEKALASLSAKEIETLVENNRELLAKEEFANRISVKQLEALEKSDKFTDEEKDNLKTARFKILNDINSTDPDKVKKAIGKIKGLADSEIEMLPAEQLSNPDIIRQFRPAQFESIAKSGKFTGNQKRSIKDIRLSPLINTLDDVKRNANGQKDIDNNLIKKMLTKDLSAKDVSGLMSTEVSINIPDPDNPSQTIQRNIPLLLHPAVIKNYTPSLLKRMAAELNPEDIDKLSDAIYEEIEKYPASVYPDSPNLKQLRKIEKWLSKEEASDYQK